ncbi:MAG: CHRD domain-containing protein [Leptolyngbyaceae bacterium]|nr:CHRD domain-containing protein [Leptolyngbyaceae bacterium]
MQVRQLALLSTVVLSTSLVFGSGEVAKSQEANSKQVAPTTISSPKLMTSMVETSLYAKLMGSAVSDRDGKGLATLTANLGQRKLCYKLEVSGIEAPTAAHIHQGRASANGPVVIPLVTPKKGLSSGCVVVEQKLLEDIVTTPSDYYVNVHNKTYPTGAIRGQLARKNR